jgi:hypothetical protein
MKVKRIYKYPTGAAIPKGAVYLNTVTQTKIQGEHPLMNNCFVDCWLVWHYFLVEVDE